MRQPCLRRSYTRTLFLLIGLHCGIASADALPGSVDAYEQQTARAALGRLLDLAERAESRRGGETAIARRRAETSDAMHTAAWLDWLPDFSIAVRRQVEQDVGSNSSAPRWRLDLEGQLLLSLPKLRATGTAGAAQAKAQAELEQTAFATRERALMAGLELYLVERKAKLVKDQIATLEALLPQTRDAVLIEGYLGEIRGTLAQLELDQRQAAQQLGATLGSVLESSGLDPRLDLPLLLNAIRTQLSQSRPRVAQIRSADTNLEQQRLRGIESQAWYLPDLRSTTLAQLPQGNGPEGASFRLAGITTEIAFGLRLRPGLPALQAAQRHAIAKSRFDDHQSRLLRERTEDEARIRIEQLSRLWQGDAGIRLASAGLDDAMRRFARGERTTSELAAASRTLLAAQLAREALLGEAVLTQITLSANDRTDLRPSSGVTQETLAPAEVDRRAEQALSDSPLLKSATADAERAEQRARSERFVFATALEAGVLLPLYDRGDFNLNGRPELSFSGSGSLTTPVREISMLGRWSFDLRTTGPRVAAFESDARWRRAHADLVRKRQQWAQLAARLELAEARKSVELSRQTVEFTTEAAVREQRWLQQGAANERDIRAADLARQIATVDLGKAEARQRSAEVLLASYLGASRGNSFIVNDTPEGLERWASERFLPDNDLLGFESSGRRREATLEADATRAQTRLLEKPARTTTFTAQAMQGLRGGAFSLTFAVGVALDPPRDALQATRAAEREGAARGRLSALESELGEQRAKLQQRFDRANALISAEDSNRQRLHTLLGILSAQQAATPDVHEAVKLRQHAELQAALFASEKRRAEADEQRRAASLSALAWGINRLAAGPLATPERTLADTEHALIEPRSEVAVADAAATVASEHQPLPVVSGLHLLGPFAVGSYSADRIAGPTTNKVWRGDLGVGLSLGLDESLAFIGSRELAAAAEEERGAARQEAALRAVHEIGRTWTARELERLSAQEETEAQRYLEGSVAPRFGLGQVTATTLIDAQQRYAFSQLRHSSDQSLLTTQRALLTAMGASVSDAALDEYQRRATAWWNETRSDTAQTAAGTTPSPAERAAEARKDAAASAVTASALRVVSPITALVEFRPARLKTTTGLEEEETRTTTTAHEVLWVFSLIMPIKPKELGTLSIAAAKAGESDDELGAATRAARLMKLGLQGRVAALEQSRASAATHRQAAERALFELDRRLRAGADHTGIDELAAARQALVDARRAEVLVTGASLEAALALRAIRENR